MLVVTAWILYNLNPAYSAFCLSVFVLFFSWRKEYAKLLCFLSLLLSQYIINDWLFTKVYQEGFVSEIGEKSFIVRHQIHQLRIIGQYSGNLYDKVRFSGNFIKTMDASSALRKINYLVSDAEVKTLTASGHYLSYLFHHLSDYPLSQSLVFHRFNDDLGLMSSLALQFQGILGALRLILARFNKSLYYPLSRALLSGVLLFFFPGFVTVRLFLGSFCSKKLECLLLLLLFPFSVLNLAFLLVYGPWFIRQASARLKDVSYTILRLLILLWLSQRIHLLENLFFRILAYLAGILFILALFPFSSGFVETNLTILASLFKSSLWLRFEFVGYFGIAAFFFFLYLFSYKSWQKQTYACLALLMFYTYPPYASLSILDVGQGDAFVLRYPFNLYVTMIDTGRQSAYYNIKRSLRQLSINHIDKLIISHEDLDHSENKEAIKEDYGAMIVTDKKGPFKVFASFLSDYEGSDANRNSLVLGLDFYGTRFLFTGDISVEEEYLILKRYPDLKADVLKLAHHGSKTSSSAAFLDALQPDIALVSADPDLYSHPHDEVMERLQERYIRVLSTYEMGDIHFVYTFGLKFLFSSSFPYFISLVR